jgi:hypothetical protein
MCLSLDSVNLQASNLEKTEGELLEFRLVIQVSTKKGPGTYRKQSVTADLICQWYDCREVGDVPAVRGEGAQVDHSTYQDNKYDIHPLEVPYNAIQPNPEPTGLEFFGRGRPFHVDAEEMAQERFEEVVGDAAEEQQKEGRPLDCFPETTEESLLTKAMA